MSMVHSFFAKNPEALPLFEAVEDVILAIVPDAKVKVQKSQVAFYSTRNFAYVWLPIRPGIKGRPETYIVVSFGLGHKITDPRIVDPVEPYPHRWTHHVIISSEKDLDAKFRTWIRAAYDFAERK